MSVRLGRLVASGKPVEVTRYAGTVGQGLMLQLTAETGYVQVQAAELLRLLHNPQPLTEIDPWSLLEVVHGELRKELPFAKMTAQLGEILEARREALQSPTEDPGR